MRENEKEREELKASYPKTFINEEEFFFFFYSVLSGAFIAKPPLQNTKKKQNKYYYRGTNWEENQKVTKEVKKSKQHEQWRRKWKFAVAVKFCNTVKLRSTAKFLQPCEISWGSLLLLFMLLFSFGF